MQKANTLTHNLLFCRLPATQPLLAQTYRCSKEERMSRDNVRFHLHSSEYIFHSEVAAEKKKKKKLPQCEVNFVGFLQPVTVFPLKNSGLDLGHKESAVAIVALKQGEA